MKFDELYSSIKNPIEDQDVINSLLNVYSKGAFEPIFYCNLVKTVEKDEFDKFNKDDKEIFYVNLFNEIKGNITRLTQEKFQKLLKEGHTRELLRFREFLLQVPDVKSTNEITEIIKKIKGANLETAFRYYFAGICKNELWQHVSLRSTTGKLEKYDKVEHRLYLNVARRDIYKLAFILKEKMKERNIPFYFKFDTTGTRDDSIIIFSSSEHFVDNLNVLKEIEQEYPEIVARINRPAVLTGMIDKWIGYGSEPITDELDIEQSFSTKRAKIVPSAIGGELKKWISQNKKTKFLNGETEIFFEDFLADYCCQKLLEKLKKNYESFEKSAKEFDSEYGYELEDIEDPRNQNILRGIIRRQINKLIDAYVVDSLTEKISINVRNQKKIYFDALDFRKAMRELAPHIGRISPEFVQSVTEAIKASSQQHGIDPNNFSFDVYAKKSLKEAMDKKLANTKTPPLLKPRTKSANTEIKQAETMTEESTKKEVEQEAPFIMDEEPIKTVEVELSKEKTPIVDADISSANKAMEENIKEKQKKEENREQRTVVKSVFAKPTVKKESVIERLQKVSGNKKNEELSNTDLPKFIKFMEPYIKNKQMILPNGTTMSAEEYLSLIVFPQLPANGVVISEKEEAITVEDFIKNGVLKECQEQYSGNFPLYLHDKTKSNFGVLKLKNNGQDFDLNVEEITEYINKSLVMKPMTLPNNTVMPTLEYISKYYLQHVPHNGLVTLANGNQISVKNYIEYILLYAVESKYSGNLPLALYETSRKNNGVIDMNPEHFKKNVDAMKPVNNIIINKSAYR